ncbi:MAG TPA: hypothetical protein VEV13_06320 [Candidatus Limnocylindria bacterium]|nr:hypothetical protein [Candidatus Limnocylindria bacterium]
MLDPAVDPPEDAASLASAHRAVSGAALGTGLLGLGLLAYALFLLVQWVGETPSDQLSAALIVGLSAGWGAAMLVCARGLRQRHRWARAPVITSALVLLAVGWLLASGRGPEVAFGWVVVVVCVGCLATLLRPTLGRALR